MRPEIVAALYRDTPVFMTQDEFRRALDAWHATSIERDGKILFIALKRGPEFHFLSTQTGEALPRRIIHDYLRTIIAMLGAGQTSPDIIDSMAQIDNPVSDAAATTPPPGAMPTDAAVDELTDVLWQAARDKVFITKSEYLESLKGWTVKAHCVDGILAFITVQRGPEFHFHSMNAKTRLSMRMIKKFLEPVIAEHGYAMTRTPHEDGRQQRFNRKLGFVEAGRTEFDVLYRIERINPSCQ